MDSAFITPEDEKYVDFNEELFWDFPTDNKNFNKMSILKHKNPIGTNDKSPVFSIGITASDKRWSAKENFLDLINKSSAHNEETTYYNEASGAVVAKKSYMEPPRINRISHSFHGKPITSCGEISSHRHRRASDNLLNYTSVSQPSNLNQSSDKIKLTRHKFLTQSSQPNDLSIRKDDHRKSSLTNEVTKTMRFTTVKVEEATHALSVANIPNKIDNTTSISKSCEAIADVRQDVNDQTYKKN